VVGQPKLIIDLLIDHHLSQISLRHPNCGAPTTQLFTPTISDEPPEYTPIYYSGLLHAVSLPRLLDYRGHSHNRSNSDGRAAQPQTSRQIYQSSFIRKIKMPRWTVCEWSYLSTTNFSIILLVTIFVLRSAYISIDSPLTKERHGQVDFNFDGFLLLLLSRVPFQVWKSLRRYQVFSSFQMGPLAQEGASLPICNGACGFDTTMA
jgi:hypothetical protein